MITRTMAIPKPTDKDKRRLEENLCARIVIPRSRYSMQVSRTYSILPRRPAGSFLTPRDGHACQRFPSVGPGQLRSEERRVGKEWRCWWCWEWGGGRRGWCEVHGRGLGLRLER